MKVLFQCEVCRRTYDLEAVARQCEAQPKPEPAPRGLIVSMVYHDESSLFAALFTGELQSVDHWHRHLTHWFRGNGAGDDDQPRSDIFSGVLSWARRADTDLTAPAVKRAIARCRKLGWKPLILRGYKPVPLGRRRT